MFVSSYSAPGGPYERRRWWYRHFGTTWLAFLGRRNREGHPTSPAFTVSCRRGARRRRRWDRFHAPRAQPEETQGLPPPPQLRFSWGRCGDIGRGAPTHGSTLRPGQLSVAALYRLRRDFARARHTALDLEWTVIYYPMGFERKPMITRASSQRPTPPGALLRGSALTWTTPTQPRVDPRQPVRGGSSLM